MPITECDSALDAGIAIRADIGNLADEQSIKPDVGAGAQSAGRIEIRGDPDFVAKEARRAPDPHDGKGECRKAQDD
jgi:hypothetical protein